MWDFWLTLGLFPTISPQGWVSCFFLFSYGIFTFRCMRDPFDYCYAVNHFGDPFLVMVMWLCGQSFRWPLFGYGYVVMRLVIANHWLWYHWCVFFTYMDYGYAVSHFEPSALIPLLGYIYIYICFGLWL